MTDDRMTSIDVETPLTRAETRYVYTVMGIVLCIWLAAVAYGIRRAFF
jgi:hypothetical protein